jgi:hypothetical protein
MMLDPYELQVRPRSPRIPSTQERALNPMRFAVSWSNAPTPPRPAMMAAPTTAGASAQAPGYAPSYLERHRYSAVTAEGTVVATHRRGRTMATNAASLPPEDEPAEPRSPAAAPVPPPPVLESLPPSLAARRQARRRRTVDFERARRLAGGNPVVVTSKLRWWVTLLIVMLFVGPLALGGVAVYRTLRAARDEPGAAAAPRADAVDASYPTAATAISLAAPVVVPALPLGATSLFEPGVAAALAPLLDQAIPGEPTQFTSIDVHPDFAATIVQDATDPTRTVRFTWRAAGVTTDEPQQEPVDISASLFTTSDVDWDRLATLVAAAHGLLHTANDPVTHVVVQRWGFDPTFPMRFLVYAASSRFIEAAADGTVLAVH